MSNFYLQDSALVYWQLGVNTSGREQNSVVGAQSIVTLVVADQTGACWQLGISTIGRLTATAVAPTTTTVIVLYDSTGKPYYLRVNNARPILASDLFLANFNRNVGIFSKDAVLSVGGFDVGIPITFGLYDDDFVAQFSGTAFSSATRVTSAPAGLFSKDATLIGAFDA